MKPAAWFGLAIILGAVGFGAKSFVTNLTPYVTFKQARESKESVQVMGALDKSSVGSDARQLSFTIVSTDGDRMPVSFTAARPANFNEATQVTAVGKFDGQVFRADNLYVKCPTKYQGSDQERSYSASGARI